MPNQIAVVSISGGKDSTATALLAIERYGRAHVRLVHADTGHEHPLTVAYVRDYLPRALGLPVEIVRADFTADFERKRTFIAEHWLTAGVPAARVARALELLHPTGVPFLDLCMWKGRFPSRKAQFCTEELKRNPLDRYMVALARTGLTLESWQGVRRDESQNRADALEWQRSDWGWMIHRPIVEWSAEETLAYAARNNVEPNPLYLLGMGRVGCMPCINCTKDELLEIYMRFPEELDRLAEWEELVSEVGKRGANSFFPVGIEDDAEIPAETFMRANIRARIEWAKTKRGGKTPDPARLEPRATCSSVYGLCE